MSSAAENLAAEAKFKRSTSAIASELDDSVVMLDVEDGRYFGADGVGYRIWQLLASPSSLEELVDRLCEEYEVSAQQCEAEVREYLTSLLKAGLIEEAAAA